MIAQAKSAIRMVAKATPYQTNRTCVSQTPIPEPIIASQAICLEPELPVICGILARKTCLYRGCCPVSAGNSLTLKREHVGPDFKLVGIVFVTDQLSTTAFRGHLKSDL